AADWAAVLEQLYDDPATRVDLGRAASMYAQRFGWEQTAEGTRAAYRTAVRDYTLPSKGQLPRVVAHPGVT
uniref:glycosyltransferase n=1 Tax=Sinomonas sp. G460-2 TaxID=3393464 RepID=UPI0039EE7E49